MLPPSTSVPAFVLTLAAFVASSRTSVGAQAAQAEEHADLTELSLEELMDIQVTVSSRHGEKLRDAPAAVYVLTGDEIRRAGHSSLQEALRMVPGFHVTQWKTAGWDVTARGFTGGLSTLNESFANQLLLMVDGVSLYSPAMAGIWWPLFDIPLDDIERVEIVRGPGGTLWGANAMNGVVNVITKHAQDTQGNRVSAIGGTAEWGGDYSYGGTLGDKGWFRTWVSYSDYRALPNSEGHTFAEDWNIASVGLRADWEPAAGQRARVLSTFYTSEFGEDPVDTSILGLPAFDDTPKNGGFISGTWETGDDDDLQRVQAWFSFDHQKQLNFESEIQTLDVEYTRQRPLSENNALTWGIGARAVQSDMGSDNGFNDFDPESRDLYQGRAFAQDEIALASLKSTLVLGLQVEDSTLGDFQVQPNVRWMWHAAEQTNVWAAVSRAVRTPSIEEVDVQNFDDPDLPPSFVGDHDFGTETLLAYEVGVRTNLSEKLLLDLTAFYNDYDNLQSFELTDDASAVTFGNNNSADAQGVELALDYDISKAWRVRSAYTYFQMDFESDDPTSFEAPFVDNKDDLIPENHFNVRSYYDLGEKWELDGAVYFTDRLLYFDQPSYWRVDLRLGYNPNAHLRFALGVQNVNEYRHAEAGEDITTYGAEIRQNIYVSLQASF